MRSFGYVTLCVVVLLFAQCLGAKVCLKKLKGKQGDIIVTKKPCILDNVTAKVITVRDGGNLTVKGISEIDEIIAGDEALVTLKNKTVAGLVAAATKASIDVFVEKTSFVRALSLIEAGRTRAEGPFGSVKLMNSGGLNLVSSTVRRDLTVIGGGGNTRVCGCIIKRLTTITARSNIQLGDISTKCAGSRFGKALNIRRGGGSVKLQGSTASFVGIKARRGKVEVSSSSFGKLVAAEVKGDVNLTTSTSKVGADLENISGKLTIVGTGFFGEVKISESRKRSVGLTTIKEASFRNSTGSTRLTVTQRGKVSMTSTNLFKGIARISQVGPVDFKGNGDVRIVFSRVNGLRVFENNIIGLDVKSSGGGILIEKSVVGRGNVESCFGKITIFQSVFRTLSCLKNSRAPVGKENSISKSATGQCAKFK